MKIIYKKLSKNFSVKKLKKFFDEILPGKTIPQCHNIIKYSSIIVGAFDNGKLVEITRALDDTVYAFIADVIVNLNYRRKGVGKKLMKRLCDELINKKIRMIFCDTNKNLIPFYRSAASFKYDPEDVVLHIRNFKK